MSGIRGGIQAREKDGLAEIQPGHTVKHRWPGLAEALRAGAPPPFRPAAPPWRDEPGLDDDEDLRKALCDVRSAQRFLLGSSIGAEFYAACTQGSGRVDGHSPGTTQSSFDALHVHPRPPTNSRLGATLPSAPASILPKVAPSVGTMNVASLGMLLNGSSSGRPLTTSASSREARTYTAQYRGRKQKAAMPPVSNWLRRELSKVKLLDPHTQSSSTLPSLDSVMSGRSVASSAPGQIPGEESEVRQMLFLQAQFGGTCSTIMRGRAEEIWREHHRCEQDRIRLRTAELRGMRHAQRASAREQREARKDVGHSEMHRMQKDASTNSIDPKERHAVEASTGILKKEKSRTSLVRRAHGKFVAATNRITVLNFLKHRRTWKDRRSAVDRLRQELKRKAKDAVSAIASQVGENWNPYLSDGSTPSGNVAKNARSFPRKVDDEEERRLSPRASLKKIEDSGESSPQLLAYLEAFQRYDSGDTGILDARNARAAMADVGVAPLTMQEKRPVAKLIMGTIENSTDDGIDFDAFVALLPRLRDIVKEIMRDDVEEWFHRGLDEDRHYDLNQLKCCLEALGSKNVSGDLEWKEVLQIFEGFDTAVALCFQQASRAQSPDQGLMNGTAASLACALSLQGRSSQGLLGTPSSAFDLFEVLFYRARERLTVIRREQERNLACDLNIPDAQFNFFRSDIIELHSHFQEFDVDKIGQLEGDSIRNCLASCGMMARKGGMPQHLVAELVVQAKIRTEKMRGACGAKVEVQSDSNSGSENASKRSSRQMSDAAGPLFVDFAEFLALVVLVRGRNRVDIRSELRTVFNLFDKERVGQIQMNMNLFNELSLQPKTKGEQLEIRTMLDEVDENGDGTFCFEEFELLVHRVHEHLDRVTRNEELQFALKLGPPGFEKSRARELRDLFHASVESTEPVLSVADLRQILEHLYLRYTSDVLLELFHEFAREEKHGMDCLGFLKMMHAVEVVKSHGHEKHRNTRQSIGGPFLQHKFSIAQ
mmetsp:Transcript_51738/g.80786  ORF Transcript_51738/g.80786 Transcript_51738/m.80786 type:complete len:997 (+) Transcript_51738:57-3047(+)